VSDAAADLNADLLFSFVSDAQDLPRSITNGSTDGVLLHGARPTGSLAARLQGLPTVWLMANRERPLWGDQVMPNNPVIGEVAMKYLAGRGHRHLACLKVADDGWSLRLRAWAFTQAAAEAGLNACVVEAPESISHDMWCSVTLRQTAERIVEQLLSCQPMPTGLFILEARLLPVIHAALSSRGLRVGEGRDVEILSCNSEGHRVPGLDHIPASVGVRADVVGRRGVELLIWRTSNREGSERVSVLVEPDLAGAKSVF
jgi:DNA-binding LacI/PurR family transcriptional regulator